MAVIQHLHRQPPADRLIRQRWMRFYMVAIVVLPQHRQAPAGLLTRQRLTHFSMAEILRRRQLLQAAAGSLTRQRWMHFYMAVIPHRLQHRQRPAGSLISRQSMRFYTEEHKKRLPLFHLNRQAVHLRQVSRRHSRRWVRRHRVVTPRATRRCHTAVMYSR